jgi:hypothetical protein
MLSDYHLQQQIEQQKGANRNKSKKNKVTLSTAAKQALRT